MGAYGSEEIGSAVTASIQHASDCSSAMRSFLGDRVARVGNIEVGVVFITNGYEIYTKETLILSKSPPVTTVMTHR